MVLPTNMIEIRNLAASVKNSDRPIIRDISLSFEV